MRWIYWLPLVVGLGGCGCTDESLPGLRITLLDSITDDPIAAEDITVIATDGAYGDTARFSTANPNPFSRIGLAYERAGQYRVEASAKGYLPWVRENVRVTDGVCHVRTVDVVARMQRLGST
jgi:hypothetical protein